MMAGRLQRNAVGAAVIVSLLALAACAGNRGSGIRVTTDEFEANAIVEGPVNLVDPPFGNKILWWPESQVAKAPPHQVWHRLIVELYPSSSGFLPDAPIKEVRYDFASDEEATSLEVTGIAREHCPQGHPDCLKHVTFAVAIGDDALRRHVLTGYRVKIRANTGESAILAMPAQQVQQQLSVVDRMVAGPAPADASGKPRLGIGVIAVTAQPYDGLPRGVIIVAVPQGSPAALAGIRPGDVLMAINGDPIRVSNDVGRIMNGVKGISATLQLRRGADFYSVKVQFL